MRGRPSLTGRDEATKGTAYGLVAYGLWGLFPLYFTALEPAGAWEILAHRIIWTFVFCAAILLARRDLSWARALVARPKLAAGVALASVLIAVNWVVYVAAVVGGNVIEASLGYFLNPIVTVALGVLVLHERLRPLQWVAVAVGLLAGIYLTLDYGRLPLVALTLALSFAAYGLAKKKLGATLEAMHSLAAETAALFPVAVAVLWWLTARGQTTFTTQGGVHTALLLLAGVATALPLLLFAAAARRIPLVTVGLLQFVTPVLQLVIGVLLLGEHMPPSRWVGFGIVWVALLVLSVDSLRAGRRGRVRTDLAERTS